MTDASVVVEEGQEEEEGLICVIVDAHRVVGKSRRRGERTARSQGRVAVTAVLVWPSCRVPVVYVRTYNYMIFSYRDMLQVCLFLQWLGSGLCKVGRN